MKTVCRYRWYCLEPTHLMSSCWKRPWTIFVIFRPGPGEDHPQNLCLDAGYTGSGEKVRERGYTPHIRSRGEEKKELERDPDFHARRWVVEVIHSFFNRFRKLLVRFEKKAANYLALVQLACAVIAWRKLIQVHRWFRDRLLSLLP